MSQNLIKSLSQTVDKIDENHLKRFISVIDKTIKRTIKFLYVEMVDLLHYLIMLYVIGPKDFIQKRNVRYLILCQTNH